MSKEPVLIVDDNATQLKLTRIILASEGYDVRTAADADEALEVLQRFRPKLILIDLQLPGIDGFTLTRRVKATPVHRDVVVLALTNSGANSNVQQARTAGCDAYLPKPINLEALPSVIAELLSRFR